MDKPAYDENVKISYETLWKAIIRPPRDDYTEDYLDDKIFTYNNRTYVRKDYEIISSRGFLMKCSFLEPSDECRPSEEMPVVIYLHGNSSSRLEGWRMRYNLMRLNINLFVFDFPGSGLSEGEYISLGYHEKNDVRIVVDFVEKLPGVGKIGLWGRSMGAATTMMYAHTDDRICAICMDSPFAEFKRLAKEMCMNVIKIPGFLVDAALGILNGTVKKKNNMDVNKIRPIDCADITTTPALFIHAKNDELIPFKHSMDLFEKYAGPKSIKPCEEGGHNSQRSRAIIDSIGKFFCKYLKPSYEEKKEKNIFDDDDHEKRDQSNLISEDTNIQPYQEDKSSLDETDVQSSK